MSRENIVNAECELWAESYAAAFSINSFITSACISRAGSKETLLNLVFKSEKQKAFIMSFYKSDLSSSKYRKESVKQEE